MQSLWYNYTIRQNYFYVSQHILGQLWTQKCFWKWKIKICYWFIVSGISQGQKPKWWNQRNAFFLVPLTLMNQQKEFLQEMSMKLHTFVNVIRQNPDYKTDACLIGKYTPSYISGYHLAELHLMLGVTWSQCTLGNVIQLLSPREKG